MKKLLAVALSLVLLLATVPVTFSADEDFTIEIKGDYTCKLVGTDGKLVVPVLLKGTSNSKKLSSISFVVGYDTDQLKYESYTSFVTGSGTMDMCNPTSGSFNCAIISANGTVLSNDLLLNLTFSLKEMDIETPITLTVTEITSDYLPADSYVGVTATVATSITGYTYTEHTAADPVVVTAPTCTQPGAYAAEQHCKYCNAAMDPLTDTVIPALEHDWGEAVYTWAADNSTCTATLDCSKHTEDACHVEQTVTATKVVTPATCEAAGNTTYTAVFSAPFETQIKEVPGPDALNHDWDTPTYVWAEDHSTCTATAVCKNDNSHVLTETVNATQQSTNATCTVAGTVTYTATFTKEVFEQQIETVNGVALGHTLGEVSYEWNADNSKCTASAECGTCHQIVTETVDSTSEVTLQPTCTEKGKTTYTATFTTAGFETQTKEVEDIDALDHSWNEPTYVWNDDNTQVTATRVCARNAEHVETQTVDTAYEETTPATADAFGVGTYTATFTNPAFTQQTKTVDIKLSGWQTFDDKTYYFGEDGLHLVGWQKLESDVGTMEWFHFGEDGAMTLGWFQDTDGLWYYLQPTDNRAINPFDVLGVMHHDEWIEKDGVRGYLNPGGSLCCEVWKKIEGNWYYFLSNGSVAKGWLEVNGKTYFLSTDTENLGVMLYGMQNIEGDTYYFGEEDQGCKRAHWQQIEGDWYWFDDDGKMVTGEQEIKGKIYYFDDNGKWMENPPEEVEEEGKE